MQENLYKKNTKFYDLKNCPKRKGVLKQLWQYMDMQEYQQKYKTLQDN